MPLKPFESISRHEFESHLDNRIPFEEISSNELYRFIAIAKGLSRRAIVSFANIDSPRPDDATGSYNVHLYGPLHIGGTAEFYAQIDDSGIITPSSHNVMPINGRLSNKLLDRAYLLPRSTDMSR